MFIFDEIDKMPEGLVDAIKPFIDYHEHVQGLDFRKTIFIFLSNTGGKEINEITFDAWKSGKHRDELSYQVLRKEIKPGGALYSLTAGGKPCSKLVLFSCFLEYTL